MHRLTHNVSPILTCVIPSTAHNYTDVDGPTRNATTENDGEENDVYGTVVVGQDEGPTEEERLQGMMVESSGQREVNGRQSYSGGSLSTTTALPSFGVGRSGVAGNHKWPNVGDGLMGHQRRSGKSIIMLEIRGEKEGCAVSGGLVNEWLFQAGHVG